MCSIVFLQEEARPYSYFSFHAGYIRIFTHLTTSAAATEPTCSSVTAILHVHIYLTCSLKCVAAVDSAGTGEIT